MRHNSCLRRRQLTRWRRLRQARNLSFSGVIFMVITTVFVVYIHNYYAPYRREGGNNRCFCPSVCLSVCPSVAYIANNSRTQRPGMKVPHLRCDSHTSFKTKRSKVMVTDGRGIPCRLNPAARLHVSNTIRRRCAMCFVISSPFTSDHTYTN